MYASYAIILIHCCQLQGELNTIRDEIMKFKVGAPARVGLVAPNDVEVPAGGTGLDPSSTNFFQVCLVVLALRDGSGMCALVCIDHPLLCLFN